MPLPPLTEPLKVPVGQISGNWCNTYRWNGECYVVDKSSVSTFGTDRFVMVAIPSVWCAGPDGWPWHWPWPLSYDLEIPGNRRQNLETKVLTFLHSLNAQLFDVSWPWVRPLWSYKLGAQIVKAPKRLEPDKISDRFGRVRIQSY